ncbi:MAG: hypothetical protein RMK30_05980 [Anaerolineae bacterium]|nr:hypothetical protein [Anaerolineae bacterium]MDW8102407.1 hypothetical protein [Anaerolineae bacterium]
MPPILNFVSPALALKYFALCFLSITGAIQIAAGRRGIEGLSLLPFSFRSWQIFLGFALICGSFALFFAITPEVFLPGLAGSELMILFGAGGIAALAFSMIIAELRGGNRFPPVLPDAEESLPGGKVAFFGGKPGEEVDCCLVPDPWEPFSMDLLARRLASSGHKVAVLHWQKVPDEKSALDFPVLALEKLGTKSLLGHRAGGNIVLRIASENTEVKAIALAPFTSVEEAMPGLGWLEEGGIFTAWKRLRGRENLIKALLQAEMPSGVLTIGPDDEVKPWGMVLSERLANLVDSYLH